jgi:hypothetical protein
MQSLKIQSKKRMTYVDGKNRQEMAKLKNINNLIEKDFMFEDMNWFKNYIDLKRNLKEIKKSTTQLNETTTTATTIRTIKTADNESTISSKKLKNRNQLTPNTFNKKEESHSAPSQSFVTTYSRQQSTINNDDYDNVDDYLEYFRKKKQDKKQKSIQSFISKTASLNSQYTINQFNDVSSIQLNKNYLKKRKAPIQDSSDDDEELKVRKENKLFNFRNIDNLVEKNSNYTTNTMTMTQHTDSNQKCNIFPCALLRSYTSMIGPENDKKTQDLRTCGLKTVLYGQFNRQNYSRLTFNSEETDSTKYSNDKITIKNDLEELDEENENRVEEEDEAFTKTIVDDLISNKSIRRPLCNLNTSKDFINKMKSLEAKAKYCQDQNKINFKKTDRNIRYGDDPPKNNIYRQLRIISKFDS